MKSLIAALAVSVLAIPLASAQIQIKEVAPLKQGASTTTESKASRSETTGGEKRNPEPHIYKLGEHLSEAYGRYELIDDWKRYQLEMPPEGEHWIRYGENYLLVTNTDGLIKRIVRAS